MKKNLHKKRGQGTLEWILILFVLVGFVMLFGKGIKGRIGGLVSKVFDTVEGKASELAQ